MFAALEQNIQEQWQSSTFRLERNHYGAVKVLAKHLRTNSNWTSLSFMGSAMGSEELEALAQALCVNSTVTDIDLSQNGIGVVGVNALTHAFSANRTVKIMNLRGNDIGDEGAVALASALLKNSSILQISLDNNGIGDKGAVALAGAIRVNSTVKSIGLTENNFSQWGLLALAASIMTKKTECTIRLGESYTSVRDDQKFLVDHGVVCAIGDWIVPTYKYPVGLNIRPLLQKFGKQGAHLVDRRPFTRSNHDGSYCAVAAAMQNNVDRTLHFMRLWPEHADEVLRERYGSSYAWTKSGLLYDRIHAQSMENVEQKTEAIVAAVAVAEAITGTSALSLVNIHLCGEGYAGKTMTRQALLHTLNCTTVGTLWLPPQLPEISVDDGRTLGMECKVSEFAGSDGAPVRALLHDYGGQLEFRANHAPHLSAPNSVYVIVVPLWDKRPGHDKAYELEDIVAMYTQWLKFLYTVVPTVVADKPTQVASLKPSAVLPHCLTVINFARLCTAAAVKKVQLRLVDVLRAYNAAPDNQRLYFIDMPIVLDVDNPTEVYNQLAPVLKNEILKLSMAPIPIAPCLQTVLTDRAVDDKWPLFTAESYVKGLIRSAMKDNYAQLRANMPEKVTTAEVFNTICEITQGMLESRRDIVVFPVHSGERISINHPNWLTNEILGSLFDPKVRPQLMKAAAMRRVEEGAEDSHLLSLQDINAAVKSKLDSATRDMIDDNFIPRLLQHVGVCIPVVVEENGLVRAVAEGRDAVAVQHWFPAFSTIAMKDTDGKLLDGAERTIARQFKLKNPKLCIFPPGYFSSLFVSIVSLHNTASLIKIFKNGMVLRSGTDRFQIVVRQTADEKSFVVTVATGTSKADSDLAFQTIQDIKKFIYSESDWRGNVRVQECGLHPRFLTEGQSIHIEKVEERLRDPKQREEYLAFYFGLQSDAPLILQKILDELLSVSKAVKQIAHALGAFHDKFTIARAALVTQLQDRQDVTLEAIHNLAVNLELAVSRVYHDSVANSQDLANILKILTSLKRQGPAGTKSKKLPSADALQVMVAGAFAKPLHEVQAALAGSAHLVGEQLKDVKEEIAKQVCCMSAELHRVVNEKLRSELQGFLVSAVEQSRAVTAAQVAALLEKLNDSANKQHDKVLEEFSQLRGSLQAVRSVQSDTVYGVYDFPPLMSVKLVPATSIAGSLRRTLCEVHRLHFVCPCCGKKAASGPNGHGYKLNVTKSWVVKASKVLRCTLLALQVLSLLTPVPLPHLADLAQYLPGDRNSAEWQALFDKTKQTMTELKGLMTELAGELGVDPFEGEIYTDAPPPESTVADPDASAAISTSTSRAPVAGPVITLEHMRSVREVLQVAEETVPLGSSQKTGLVRAMCNRTGQCAWVCQQGEDGQDSACKIRYMAEGNDCLAIQMVLG